MLAKKNRIKLTVVVLLGLVGLVMGLFVATHVTLNPAKQKDFSQFNGTLLAKPRQMAAFSLQGSDGHAFTNDSLQGHWTLMFFGFTHCGYLCPTTMAELAKFYRQLQDKNVSAMPDIVMVSIDPPRDTLEKLTQYVTAFHPAFKGARGESDTVRSMARELGIAYFKVDQKNTKQYDVDHTGTVILFNPKGEIQAFFSSPQDAEKLTYDYELLVS